MKLALFHNVPSGGAKRVLYEQIRLLSKNHTVDLYTIAATEEDFLDFHTLPISITQYKFSLNSSHRLLADYKNFVTLATVHKKIAKEIDAKQYDCVIVHPDRFTQAPFLLQFLSTPSIYYCEEWLRIAYEKEFAFTEKVGIIKTLYEQQTRRIRKNIDRKNVLSATAVLANSQFTKRNIEKTYDIQADVCYPGVDTQVFSPGKQKKENKVLFIGQPITFNGYDLVQEAFTLLPKDISLRLEVVDPSEHLIRDDILRFHYASSLATVCFSVNEPFGLVPLESMSCKTPVIALNQGGYKETVVNNKTGFLVEKHPQAIAFLLQKLLASKQLQHTLGKQGREHVMKNFSWKNHLQVLEQTIKKTMYS